MATTKRELFMVLVGPTGAVFVKEFDFFRSQGGLEQPWGEEWVPVVAADIDGARVKGCKLPGAKPYASQALVSKSGA